MGWVCRAGDARAHSADRYEQGRRGALRDGDRQGRLGQSDPEHQGCLLRQRRQHRRRHRDHERERSGVFCYTGTKVGADAISAFADTDGSGSRGLTEPAGAAANVCRRGTGDPCAHPGDRHEQGRRGALCHGDRQGRLRQSDAGNQGCLLRQRRQRRRRDGDHGRERSGGVLLHGDEGGRGRDQCVRRYRRRRVPRPH